jgi:hypothetical protein
VRQPEEHEAQGEREVLEENGRVGAAGEEERERADEDPRGPHDPVDEGASRAAGTVSIMLVAEGRRFEERFGGQLQERGLGERPDQTRLVERRALFGEEPHERSGGTPANMRR